MEHSGQTIPNLAIARLGYLGWVSMYSLTDVHRRRDASFAGGECRAADYLRSNVTADRPARDESADETIAGWPAAEPRRRRQLQ